MPEYAFIAEGFFEFVTLDEEFVPGNVSEGGLAYWGESAVT